MIQIQKNDGNKKLIFTFEDTGIPFNQLEKLDPDITLSANERKIDGLGIFLTKKQWIVLSTIMKMVKIFLLFQKL